MRRIGISWAFILFVGLAFLSGFLIRGFTEQYAFNECVKRFAHLHTSVVCDDADPVIQKGVYSKLKDELVAYIEEQKRMGAITDAAVYFRDLNFGPTFGINDARDFAPASLLKLPIALAYMNLEENRPGTLDQAIVHDLAFNDVPQTYSSLAPLEVGKSYAIKDLLFNMLAHSDNASLNLLITYIGQISGGESFLYQSFQDIGIMNPNSPRDPTIDVHTIGALFRILHNASYLTPENSEKILAWLSQSTFKDGLVAGVPDGTNVAHKFGERQDPAGVDTQFHDCGIIFYPGNPYSLCVMTSGRDTKELVKIIAEISGRVYTEVNSRRL